ncbi:MAG: PTS fructose transporter subunit IIA [Proteobacteria bacterium]|nr:MAG: PTS fructose transporter subunit IIA [Pseudomonadota bacterium]QKK11874.1 MAG: PTS fructose transporter subunit IIA [Pseudomonadota bacterium]
MSVGLLIITHEGIGGALLRTATHTLKSCPINAVVLEVPQDNRLESHQLRARRLLDQVDQGDGVLILTDLYGATPGNIASALHDGRRVITVTGINLPMVMRVLNYSSLPLEELAEKAIGGGKDCIFACDQESGCG